MSKGLRSRTICFRFLMFALALQAMTPDARDLSSPALFKLIGISAGGKLAVADSDVPASDFRPEGGDSLPTRTDDQSEQSEEVCLPGGWPTVLIVHRGQDGSNRPPSFLNGLSEPLARYPGRDLFRSHTGHIRAGNLSISLVRLTC